MNRHVTDLRGGLAFVTQWDFISPSIQEAYHGYQTPLKRVFYLMLAYTMIHTILFVQGMLVNPIFPLLDMNMSPQDEHTMIQTHSNCYHQICHGLTHNMNFDCIVQQEQEDENLGTIATVDYSTYNGSYNIPIPSECRYAIQKTFDYKVSSTIDLIRLVKQDDEEEETIDTNPFFMGMTIFSDCSFSVGPESSHRHLQEQYYNVYSILRLLSHLNFDSNPHFYRPNQRISQPLQELFFCSTTSTKKEEEEINQHYANNDRLDYSSSSLKLTKRDLALLYRFIFRYRHYIAIMVYTTMYVVLSIATLVVTMLKLLPLVWIVRLVLPWPKDTVHHQGITYWNIWKTYVLLSIITRSSLVLEEDDIFPISTTITFCYNFTLVLLAYFFYNNERGIIEFVFISLCRVLLEDGMVDDHFDFSGTSLITKLDMFHIVPWLIYCIPGSNTVEQLVFLYAMGRSYPMIVVQPNNSKRRRRRRRSSYNPTTTTTATNNNNNQRSFEEQPNLVSKEPNYTATVNNNNTNAATNAMATANTTTTKYNHNKNHSETRHHIKSE